MSMKVNVDFKILVHVSVLRNYRLSRPDCRMIPLRWIIVESVQVLSQSIKPVVPSGDAIWIESRHYFEDVVLPQQPSLLTFQICD